MILHIGNIGNIIVLINSIKYSKWDISLLWNLDHSISLRLNNQSLGKAALLVISTPLSPPLINLSCPERLGYIGFNTFQLKAKGESVFSFYMNQLPCVVCNCRPNLLVRD